MNPSNRELQQSKNCQLYVYVLESLGREVPEEIQECANSYDYVFDCAFNLSNELKNLDSESFEKIVKNKELLKSRELSYWWDMQQEADRLHRVLSSGMK